MTNALPTFRLEQVSEHIAPQVYEFCLADGVNDLIGRSRAEVLQWCKQGSGMVAFDDTSDAIAGACFFEEKNLPVAGGARSVYGDLTFLYVHHQVVAPQCRNLGLGRRIGEATIALAFATLDGPFPSCVTCTFLDSPSSLRSQRRAGMLVVPQWDAAIIDSFPLLRALDSHAWATKARMGTERPHALEYFHKPELFRIAHWMTIAFAFPYRDPTDNFVLRIVDLSQGRSGFRRAMRALACRETFAMARFASARDENIAVGEQVFGSTWKQIARPKMAARRVTGLSVVPGFSGDRAGGEAQRKRVDDDFEKAQANLGDELPAIGRSAVVLKFPRSPDERAIVKRQTSNAARGARTSAEQRAHQIIVPADASDDDGFSFSAISRILAPPGFVGHLLKPRCDADAGETRVDDRVPQNPEPVLHLAEFNSAMAATYSAFVTRIRAAVPEDIVLRPFPAKTSNSIFPGAYQYPGAREKFVREVSSTQSILILGFLYRFKTHFSNDAAAFVESCRGVIAADRLERVACDLPRIDQTTISEIFKGTFSSTAVVHRLRGLEQIGLVGRSPPSNRRFVGITGAGCELVESATHENYDLVAAIAGSLRGKAWSDLIHHGGTRL